MQMVVPLSPLSETQSETGFEQGGEGSSMRQDWPF